MRFQGAIDWARGVKGWGFLWLKVLGGLGFKLESKIGACGLNY